MRVLCMVIMTKTILQDAPYSAKTIPSVCLLIPKPQRSHTEFHEQQDKVKYLINHPYRLERSRKEFFISFLGE